MATILTKKSDTSSSVPVAADLTNAAGGAELAVNTADKRLFAKNSGGTVVELGTSPSALTLPNGTANAVPYLNGSKVLTSGSALTYNGTGLGVGISSAGYLVDISTPLTGTTVGSNVALNLESQASGRDVEIRMGDTVNSSGRFGYLSGSLYWAFGSTEQMRLTSTGLGIGTSSPSNKLTVSSAGTIARFISSNTGAYIALQTSDNNGNYIGSVSGATVFQTSDTERMRLDTSGNLGLGVTPSAWYTAGNFKNFDIGAAGGISGRNQGMALYANAYVSSALSNVYKTNFYALQYSMQADTGNHAWFTAPSGTAGNAISFTQAMTLDASGNLLVGTTTSGAGLGTSRIAVEASVSTDAICAKSVTFNYSCVNAWNSASSGNNSFMAFWTDSSPAFCGSITYNRGAGLVAYNVTSDYRAKDIIGLVVDSGALIDSVPVYMGKMKGATQERPMFIAHEVPAYAHTGEKDAVDADGKPVYQQMDASALVPVMWAEIQSLRQRLAALESK